MIPGTFLVSPAGPYRTLSDLWDEGDEQQGAPMEGARATHEPAQAQQ